MARPECVVFDLDETLMPETSSVWAAFSATCAPAAERFGVELADLVSAARRHARELWFASPHHPWCLDIGVASWEGLSGDLGGGGKELVELRRWAEETDYRQRAWRAALADVGVEDEDLVDELSARFVHERPRHHRLYPDSRSTLEALRGEVRLALLTNGAPRIQHGKIDGTGIRSFFDAIVVSGEIGIGKPHATAFAAVTDKLGVDPAACLMVGDSLTRDIAGGSRFGMRTAFVARRGLTDLGEVQPDFVVDSVDGILGVLQREQLEVRAGW